MNPPPPRKLLDVVRETIRPSNSHFEKNSDKILLFKPTFRTLNCHRSKKPLK
ncbi:hypothetical protein BH695_4553 [Microcystis aeruginosa PCC 7806SL]|uniref:Uncharacterized protein n=2 Tax=Microcystis aeruginosa (strain PCC 7806) TaxID=267872 RepID=A0AB33BVF9_MICA7|nr:hypothetical protein BH695_4553 [Microcystis aeruginosa PCC 7806SL]